MKIKGKCRNFKHILIKLLLITTIILPPNSLGLPYKHQHGSSKYTASVPKNVQIVLSGTDSHKENNQILQNDESNAHLKNYKVLYDMISWNIVAVMSIICFVSPFLALPLVWYLQDRPLNQHCIMSSLYQDVCKLNLVMVLLWTISTILIKIMACSSMDPSFLLHFAKCISLISHALFWLIMLYLCFIGTLRLYTTRTTVFDPLADYFGGNETLALIVIRSALATPVGLLITTLIFTSTTTSTYYWLTGFDGKLVDLPFRTLLLQGADIAIATICASIFIAARLYQHKKDYNFKKYCKGIQCQNNGDDDVSNDERNHQNSTNLPLREDIMAFLTTPTLAYTSNCIICLGLLFLNNFKVIQISFWCYLTTFLVMQGVFIPLGFMASHSEARSYYRRKIEYYRDGVVGRVIGIRRRIKMLNSRVSPT